MQQVACQVLIPLIPSSFAVLPFFRSCIDFALIFVLQEDSKINKRSRKLTIFSQYKALLSQNQVLQLEQVIISLML
jgi:hypothetical protein